MKYKKIYYIFSGTLIALSVIALSIWGLKLGIDFKGGSFLFGSFNTERLSQDEASAALKKVGIEEVVVQPTGDKDITLRFKDVDENKHQEIIKALEESAQGKNKENHFTQKSFESIGPSIGTELRYKALTATFMVLGLILAYIAFAFRHVSSSLASWKYGLAALIALMHDIIIPLGVFAVLGHFYNVEISSSFIAAILTVLGYSVHDSIIVFDRIRENLAKGAGKTFEEIANISVNQTFVRSINTSLTVILTLLAIYIFGGESIKYLALMLIVGVGVGTYSSIFIGSALLVTWYNRAMVSTSRKRT